MTISNQMMLGRDVTGAVNYSLVHPVDAFQTTLAQNVVQTLTVPNSHAQWDAIFAIDPGLRIWIAVNATATLPGGSFTATTSFLNPTIWRINAGDVISFITPDAIAQLSVRLDYVRV